MAHRLEEPDSQSRSSRSAFPRSPPSLHYPASGKGRSRADLDGYRRTSFPADAGALQPCADAGQARSGQGDRFVQTCREYSGRGGDLSLRSVTMRPHECPHKEARLKGKHRLPPVVTSADWFSLNPWKLLPIYQSMTTDHSLSRSARFLREQEVRSSNLRAPTNVFNNLRLVVCLAGTQHRPKCSATFGGFSPLPPTPRTSARILKVVAIVLVVGHDRKESPARFDPEMGPQVWLAHSPEAKL